METPVRTKEKSDKYGLPIGKLRSETDFAGYLRLLKLFAQKYVVLVNGVDTPVGPGFTSETLGLYLEAGFQAKFFRFNGTAFEPLFRSAYAAVIDSGRLICEEVRENNDHIDITFDHAGNKIHILSKGFMTLKYGDKCVIEINGRNYSQGLRGLNFVIYDKVSQTVVDTVNFDTFAQKPIGIHAQARIDEWVDFMDADPDINIVGFNFPDFPTSEYATDREKYIVDNNVDYERAQKLFGNDLVPADKYYDRESFAEVTKIPRAFHDHNGVRRFEDFHGRLMNTVGGYRVTTDQPSISPDHNSNIYIYIYNRRLSGIRNIVGGQQNHRVTSSEDIQQKISGM